LILSNIGIQEAIRKGLLEILPEPKDDQYTTSAVDLYLGGQFKYWDWKRLSIPGAKTTLSLTDKKFNLTASAHLLDYPAESDGSYILPPYSSGIYPVLAMTRERVHLKPKSCCAARVEGRSSLARLGLIVHLTALIIHSGFNPPITLEMINHGPFHWQLHPGKTIICRLVVERVESEPTGEIRTSFQNQMSPSGSGRLTRLQYS
jgi:dCTP deaminase